MFLDMFRLFEAFMVCHDQSPFLFNRITNITTAKPILQRVWPSDSLKLLESADSMPRLYRTTSKLTVSPFTGSGAKGAYIPGEETPVIPDRPDVLGARDVVE